MIRVRVRVRVRVCTVAIGRGVATAHNVHVLAQPAAPAAVPS